MGKSKIIKCAIWFLTFALSVFLLLVIPSGYSQSIWVTLVFDVIAFVSQLILWLTIFNRPVGAKGVFNRYPTMLVSALYLIVEFIICIVTAVMESSIPFKTSMIINFIVMVIAWIVLLMMILSKDHVERIDSRQKDHHVEL